SDHGAPGGETAIAAGVGSLADVGGRLRGAATVEVGAVWVGGVPVGPEAVRGPVDAIDVVVWNTATGHAFPGGTHDLQDTWLEVVAFDGEGHPVGASGTTPGDPDAERFRAQAVDPDGHPEDLHRTAKIRGAAYDRTVPPLGAVATRYAVTGDVRAIEVRLL